MNGYRKTLGLFVCLCAGCGQPPPAEHARDLYDRVLFAESHNYVEAVAGTRATVTGTVTVVRDGTGVWDSTSAYKAQLDDAPSGRRGTAYCFFRGRAARAAQLGLRPGDSVKVTGTVGRTSATHPFVVLMYDCEVVAEP